MRPMQKRERGDQGKTEQDLSEIAQGDVDALLASLDQGIPHRKHYDLEGGGRIADRTAALAQFGLIMALGADRLDLIAGLVARGADPDRPTPAGTLLHRAAGMGRLEAVRALVAAGAGTDRNEPLDAAAREGHAAVALALLEAGARPTPVALAAAAARGSTDVVSALLARGADPAAAVEVSAFAGEQVVVGPAGETMAKLRGIVEALPPGLARQGVEERLGQQARSGSHVALRVTTPLELAEENGHSDAAAVLRAATRRLA